MNQLKPVTSDQTLSPSDRLEQFKLVYDYISGFQREHDDGTTMLVNADTNGAGCWGKITV